MAVSADGQQPLHSVGGDQAASGVEVKAQHAPTRGGENLLPRAVGIHAQNAPAGHGDVEQAVARHHKVLWASLVTQRNKVQSRQPFVGGVRSGIARRATGALQATGSAGTGHKLR